MLKVSAVCTREGMSDGVFSLGPECFFWVERFCFHDVRICTLIENASLSLQQLKKSTQVAKGTCELF